MNKHKISKTLTTFVNFSSIILLVLNKKKKGKNIEIEKYVRLLKRKIKTNLSILRRKAQHSTLNNHLAKTLLSYTSSGSNKKAYYSSYQKHTSSIFKYGFISTFLFFFKFALHAKMNITKEYIFKQTNIKV